MKAPLSWLKQYVAITLPAKTLGERLTEIGLGCEKIEQVKGDTIFDLEITPNRPDLLSILGVAREIAAIENKVIKLPEAKTPRKPTKTLPLEIKINTEINPRFTAIIITGITVKESPKWLVERLDSIGQRSINNIVDITNFVMSETGNPLHAFDYDKISGHIMHVAQAQEGEDFVSVDGISYQLPKGAVIIRDKETIIDLCGIKGGQNSGTFPETKTIVLRVPVEVPQLIRRTSQQLGLRSEASSIFERGVNKGGTLYALKRAVGLVLELAGGEVASEIYDMKAEEFGPWKLEVRIARIKQILGIEIPEKKIVEILESLNLSPKIIKQVIQTTIPTYRNDLKIEEDLIEEIARMYGYNNFPKTLPNGQIPTEIIPYFKDYRLDERIKQILKAGGFSEIYTYSLVGEKDLAGDNKQALRVDNPVSREFEYLRTSLLPGLANAVNANRVISQDLNLFELGKIYRGKNISEATEAWMLSGISTKKDYLIVKGVLERLLEEINARGDVSKYMKLTDLGVTFEMPLAEITQTIQTEQTFVPLPKYPPVVEDVTFQFSSDIPTGDILGEIKKQSKLIATIELIGIYEQAKTFHIVYQDTQKNLTNQEVAIIRERIIKHLGDKFQAKLK